MSRRLMNMNKEISSIDKDIRIAEEIMIRSLASKFYNDNGILFTQYELDTKMGYLIIIPDKPLLEHLLENKFIDIEESTVNSDAQLHPYLKRVLDVNDDRWIELDPLKYTDNLGTADICLYAGIDIKVENIKYPVNINYNSFGMPLRVSECNNFKYLIFIDMIGATYVFIRKEFKSINEGFGFSIMTVIDTIELHLTLW
jgi:hypothetical protein